MTAVVNPEALEPRRLLAVTVVTPAAPLDVTPLPGSQEEPAVAVDPANPSRVFVASNSNGVGLAKALSSDGGATWTTGVVADDADGLPVACCDPSAAFDTFGNLFLGYLSKDPDAGGEEAEGDGVIVLAVSTDGGQTFAAASVFAGGGDRPTLEVGNGSVWVAFRRRNDVAQQDYVVLAGAPVTGPGAVGPFSTQTIGGPIVNVADLAAGVFGEVAVAYQTEAPRGGSTSSVVVHVDPDGLGPLPVGPAVVASGTNVDGFDAIPAQPVRTVDASVTLAYDTSAGPYRGRLYLVYSDETPNESGNTEVMLRYSDDGGASWGEPARVNDDATAFSQFFPRVAVDDSTGAVAVGFYDCREDTGTPGAGGLDSVANDEPQFYLAVGAAQPNGVLFAPNVRLSAAPSSAVDARDLNEFGDYVGLDAAGGFVVAAWGDNSTAMTPNAEGTRRALDVAAARVAYGLDPDPLFGQTPTLRVHPPPPVLRRRQKASFTVEYLCAEMDRRSLRSRAILVTGPNGYSRPARVARVKRLADGGYSVTYVIRAPSGRWKPRDAGSYVVALTGDGPRTTAGAAAAERAALTRLLVAVA